MYSESLLGGSRFPLHDEFRAGISSKKPKAFSAVFIVRFYSGGSTVFVIFSLLMQTRIAVSLR